MVWYGLTIGAVVGGNVGGGASNGKDEKKGGAHGLFSVFGHQVWLYLGGMVGWGENAGIYLTTGPMIGTDPDWAIGGGVHVMRTFGFGMVLPIRQMLYAGAAHSDKISYLFDQGQYYACQIGNTAQAVMQSGLEKLVC